MARRSKGIAKKALFVSVDICRVRLQTGEPIVFVDGRKAEDQAASGIQIAGSIPWRPEAIPALPSHKHNYIVVYCG